METPARLTKLESLAEDNADRLTSLELAVLALLDSVRGLDRRTTVLEQDVAVIKSNYATKADIAEVKTAIAEAKAAVIVWGVGAFVAMAGVVLAAAKFVR